MILHYYRLVNPALAVTNYEVNYFFFIAFLHSLGCSRIFKFSKLDSVFAAVRELKWEYFPKQTRI